MRLGLIAIGVGIVSILGGFTSAQTTAPAAPEKLKIGDRVQVVLIEGGDADSVAETSHAVVDELGNVDVPVVGQVAVNGVEPAVVERSIADVIKMDKKMRLPLVAVTAVPHDQAGRKIGAGDTISIRVEQNLPRFMSGGDKQTVDANGVFKSRTLGVYRVAGLTPAELKTVVGRSMVLRQVLKNPKVTVTTETVGTTTTTPTTQPTP